MTHIGVIRTIFLFAFFAAANTLHAQSDLAGPTWQLVAFKSMDGTTLRPDEPANYTLKFTGDGRLAVRADCNRGSAAWTSSGNAELKIGPVAATRAMCPPGSMSDQLLRDLSDVASFAIQGGRLTLTLKADAGIYDFEAQSGSANAGGVAAAVAASNHTPNSAPTAQPASRDPPANA